MPLIFLIDHPLQRAAIRKQCETPISLSLSLFLFIGSMLLRQKK